MARRPLISRTDTEGGFATIAVVILCLGLSVVSIALIDRSFSALTRVQNEVAREGQRLALRSAIARTSADLANKPAISIGDSTVSVDGLTVMVSATNEQAKTDIIRADISRIELALAQLKNVSAEDLAAGLIADRQRDAAPGRSLDDRINGLVADKTLRACLRERLTVYGSSVDPLNAPQAGLVSKDGAIVNIRARTTDLSLPDITRERIVVLTGNRIEPLIILDERSFRSAILKECVDDK